MKNRRQYVIFINHESNVTDVANGVPQGSILGPLLFNIYVNDLKNVSDKFKFIMYADDTAIYFNLDMIKYHMIFNPDMREAEIIAELYKINVWLKVNKLTLNTSKTKLMVFHRKPRHISELNISPREEENI